METHRTKRTGGCVLADGFSVWVKTFAQLSFWAMGIAGTVGIVLADWPWVLPYVAVYWYGVPGLVMRHLNCPRCPHLWEYGDCLQAPVALTRWLIKERKPPTYATSERFLFYTIFLLIPTYPIFWLASNTILLTIFAIGAVMWYSGQLFYFCKRCRVSECPFNRVASAA
jgi:hypothetical protein